jgi:16S rRNA (adenine1518-N6/adenine1519-N6)-dimethyltransferase
MRTKWSQNFLADSNVARKCVAALDIHPDDSVLEIGPGKGALTEMILAQAGRVAAVEIDPELAGPLDERLRPTRKLTLFQSDFLDVDLESIFPDRANVKVIGNLPYAVTSPILQKVLAWPRWETGVFMMQKEVGDRIRAPEGGKDYSVLSVSVQSRCRAEKVFNVPRGCFNPQPQVESSVLKFTRFPRPLFDPAKEKEFFSVVKGSFAHRRKTIVNSLSMALGFPDERIQAALQAAGIPETNRAETVSVQNFVKLAEAMFH